MKDYKPTSGLAIPPERMAAARALYEAHPTKRLRDVAEETGISLVTIKRYSSAQGWRKGGPTDFDKLTKKYVENLPANPTEVDHDAAAELIMKEHAMEERQRVLERHRKELDLPRKLAYQAVQTNNFDTAKLAKISSETLRNVQDMERRAWGIDKGGNENNITVVIERG
ncbi:hypothetical protein EU642_21865 [Salmonella enterica]|nr:hypothetical protein [Salmonella enterica]EAO0118501.1 hypothetical protein [Salmonella enterica]EAO3601606.1 hypothetical protein [Salmonella enterica]EAR6391499.1 hypothetical protein [Salmonella enterica]EAV1285263.1 hypothetical protein [Salmonella enterica]